MEISRMVNGVGMIFELSERELYQAFLIKQRKFDIEEIRYAIERFNDGAERQIDAEKVLANEDLCTLIIKNYYDYLYENDGERWYAMVEENVPDEYYTTEVE